jgi:hypothetical protein
VERSLRLVGAIGVATLEGAIRGVIGGFLKVLGPERLSLFIENNWSMLEALFKAMVAPPREAYEHLGVEGVQKVRMLLLDYVAKLLVLARTVVSKFPPELVESKITGDWLYKKLEDFPEVRAIVDRYGDRGRWWLEMQARDIRDWFLGRVVVAPDGSLVRVVKGGKARSTLHEGGAQQDHR